jgi:Icc-related predicted phosphoesterase
LFAAFARNCFCVYQPPYFSPFIFFAPADTLALAAIMHDAQVDLVLQGHVHCAERVHAQYNGTVVTLPVNEGAGPASQVCMALTAGACHWHRAMANLF